MTDGLCLQAPENQNRSASYQYGWLDPKARNEYGPAAAPVSASRSPRVPLKQRVQGKSLEATAAEIASPVPNVTSIRVTVTATNGVPDARINEIRLYDAEGIAPFPKQEHYQGK